MSVEGIITGHEREFDFPRFDGEPTPYLIAATPRSGSSLLSHLMWATGQLGAPLEYLNFAPAGPGGKAAESPHRQTELWDKAIRFRTSPNGIFGFKAFPLQLEELAQLNPPLLARVMRFLVPARGEGRMIRLRRRDSTAHAISYARAMMSGVWRREQEERGIGAETTYSQAAIERAARLIEVQDGAWDAMARDLQLRPLVLFHEDIVTEPGAAVETVADWLGVTLDPDARVEIPKIRQQSQDQAREWRRLYEAS